jgi:hypothetical protein
MDPGSRWCSNSLVLLGRKIDAPVVTGARRRAMPSRFMFVASAMVVGCGSGTATPGGDMSQAAVDMAMAASNPDMARPACKPNNTTAGQTACGSNVCDPGNYCKDPNQLDPALACFPGCVNESNCMPGQGCDLSNPATDINGNTYGACRSCTFTPPDMTLGPTCVTNTSTDGTVACGPTTCSAGTYCFDPNRTDFLGPCGSGCTSSKNCPMGQGCDLSDPATGGVGVCRSCASSFDAGTQPCYDVSGTFMVNMDPRSTLCTLAFPLTCVVTQNGCNLSWSCTDTNGQASNFFASGSVNSSGVEMYMNGPQQCGVMFQYTPRAFIGGCGGGGPTVCIVDGT